MRRAVVDRRLRPWLRAVLGLYAALALTGGYLLAVRFAGWLLDADVEGLTSVWMFLLHLVIGLLAVVPTTWFVARHLRRAVSHPNRRAVAVGLGLLGSVIMLIVSGVLLIRLEGVIELRDPAVREVIWWLHVAAPVAAAWLFVLHRLAGPRVRWRVGARVAAASLLVGAGVAVASFGLGGSDEIPSEPTYPPAMVRVVGSGVIPAGELMRDGYCRECHADVHDRWSLSAHRLSSFTNPAYRFSVEQTRKTAQRRDGNVLASRFCAGCHDPVPLLAGRFDDPDFDPDTEASADAGITCTVCHAVTAVNSPRGNADLTIEAPTHYPFAFSDHGGLRWLSRQLVRARPELHRRTFLKPLHRTEEFCGACHKVFLPEEVNHYRWLRGQNHYDSFRLSGVSGHGIASFYYPEQASENCSGCHMPPRASDDLGARRLAGVDGLAVHDHLFPAANTAVAGMAGLEGAPEAEAAHREILEGSVRVDIFGVRRDGAIDGELMAPIRPELPELHPGSTYLVEVVLRTLTLGHLLTQGTADSNQLWLEVTVRDGGGRSIGSSGGMEADGRVDPWSHFVNAYILDRDGRRIDRRNAEDIFVALYNHQIPPGAADAVHYRVSIPPDAEGPVEIDAALHYRKFDTTYLRHIYGDDRPNRLPVVTLGRDRVRLPLAGRDGVPEVQEPPAPDWVRWNDYGIGLLRKSGRGQLRQAEAAFERVERLGRPDGPLNLARVYLREGRVAVDAPAALARAAAFDPPAREWSVLWFSALVKRQNADLDGAIGDLEQILDGGFGQAKGRGFDFSIDDRVHAELGATLYERALQERGPDRRARRDALLVRAEASFRRVLELDPENLAAHWGLRQVLRDQGRNDEAAHHDALHAKYKPDDNARDRAITMARRADPAADHAAEAVTVYDLQRHGGEEPDGG